MSVVDLIREEVDAPPLANPVEDGPPSLRSDREDREWQKYETGAADADAARVDGPYREPWLNVLAAFEPGTPPALEALLTGPAAAHVRGQVVDLGCGTGWAVARLSRVPAVEHVIGVDLSRRFLETVTRRVIGKLSGDAAKIRLIAGSFERIPVDNGRIDAAFLVAAIHHALSPRVVLREAVRALRPDGRLFLIEAPSPRLLLSRTRRKSIAETERSGATEIVYSLDELRYLVEWSGFDIESIVFAPAPPSRTVARSLARRIFRLSRIEHLTSLPTRIVVAKPRTRPS